MEDREVLKKGRKIMDDKKVNGWLGLFVVVWRKLALRELKGKNWMVRVRSADDLRFALSLLSGARRKVGMCAKDQLPAWRKVSWGWRRWRGW